MYVFVKPLSPPATLISLAPKTCVLSFGRHQIPPAAPARPSSSAGVGGSLLGAQDCLLPSGWSTPQPFSAATCCEPMDGVRPRLVETQSKLSSRDMLAHVSLKPLSLRSLHKRTLRLSRLLTSELVSAAPFGSSACSSLRLERREQTDGRLLTLPPDVEPAVDELRRADRLAMRPNARIALPVFYNTQKHMPRACMQLETHFTHNNCKFTLLKKQCTLQKSYWADLKN